MFPFIANEIAFMNSVVFGTSANNVTPRNFSSIPEPSKTTSTTSTKISVIAEIIHQSASTTDNETERPETANSPAMIAYSAVHANNTLALVVRLTGPPEWYVHDPSALFAASNSLPQPLREHFIVSEQIEKVERCRSEWNKLSIWKGRPVAVQTFTFKSDSCLSASS